MPQKTKKPNRRVRRKRVGKDGQMLIQYPLSWGGKRPGAGRKPRGNKAGVPHLRRPHDKIIARWPLHVVLSVVDGLPSLRTRQCMTAIRKAFYGSKNRFGLRLTEFCVQRNHIHLVAEADDRQALLRGMRGFSIRVARQLNAALGRKGKVLADRYHVEVLDSFSRIRHCLAYVLNNERRHCYQHGGWIKVADYIDPCSSGPFFDGWRQPIERPSGVDPPVVQARGYPLREGWRRCGLISIDEIPGRRKGAQ